jgi:predicted RNA polymerase sigma factor
MPRAASPGFRRVGRDVEARDAYGEALLLTENTVERTFLERRLAAIATP